ncbi:glycosyltransferase 87 family protein [Nocardia jejuensis]|uniref:glycosyltransferase 87 family protein n=1 Tax=Nocardia jejuensis TaxID=328049 RepID=UPI000A052029|nr:glycosyltransferase 87 family protein [Nocardia jejuensis]
MILLFATVDPWSDLLTGGLDAHVYRDGAERALHGVPLYQDPTFFGLLYTYTPFSALAFIPVALLPWSWLTNGALLLNISVLYACILLSWKMIGYRITPRLLGLSALLAITSLFLEPVRTTMFFGQINLVLMLLVMWDFSRPEGSRTRGVGVGLAAGIKLVPGYFIVQYLVLRQWRSAFVAAMVLLATVVLAWIVLPDDSREYWLSTFFHSDRIALDTNPANQSVRGMLAHLSGGRAPLWLWMVLAGMVAGASMVITSALERCGERLLAVTLAGMTACAVSPFAWGHHWVWYVPLLVYLVHRAQSDRRWWLAAAALFVSTGAWAYQWSENYLSIGLFLLPKPWHTEPILENSHVIVYLVALIYGAVVARQPVLARRGSALGAMKICRGPA